MLDVLVHFLRHKKGQAVRSPVIALDIFQTGLTSIRWLKWFMETSQIIAVTGQRCMAVHTTTRTMPLNIQFPSPPNTHTHTLTVLWFLLFFRVTNLVFMPRQPVWLCQGELFFFLELVKQSTPDRLLILFPVYTYFIQ